MTSNKFHNKDYRFLQIMKALINGIPVYSKKLREHIWLSEDMTIVTKRKQVIVHVTDNKVVSEEHTHDEIFLPVLLDNPLKLIYEIATDISDKEFIELNGIITLNEL